MYQSFFVSLLSSSLIISSVVFSATSLAGNIAAATQPEPYCQWQVDNYAIEKPLCGLVGDPERGKLIVSDGSKGNCLACHRLPIDGIAAYGTIGPPLAGVGTRLTEGFIRLRVVDTRNISPMSIMPGFYRDPSLINRPRKDYKGKTFLTAQQVEDVIAYLVTLK
ncbi:MAG: sulfur oxidation c-type cytochrome SoxX [Gammaproteobacteria bacterium]|nr:sulfur oxidation c-type cytochrome SoxX [Gammaproteobacteria bacterium]